jgi:hypothetical protein
MMARVVLRKFCTVLTKFNESEGLLTRKACISPLCMVPSKLHFLLAVEIAYTHMMGERRRANS